MALGAILGQSIPKGISNIETGSYIGNGQYGASNPTIIPTNRKPKLLMIVSNNVLQNQNVSQTLESWLTAEITEYKGYFSNSSWPVYLDWGEEKISIWSNGGSASLQFNDNGITFYYAIFY